MAASAPAARAACACRSLPERVPCRGARRGDHPVAPPAAARGQRGTQQQGRGRERRQDWCWVGPGQVAEASWGCSSVRRWWPLACSRCLRRDHGPGDLGAGELWGTAKGREAGSGQRFPVRRSRRVTALGSQTSVEHLRAGRAHGLRHRLLAGASPALAPPRCSPFQEQRTLTFKQ